MSDETAWLIERGETSSPEYWAGWTDGLRGDFVWTKDASKAWRWDYGEAKHNFRSGLVTGEIRLTEHEWPEKEKENHDRQTR